MPFKLRFLLVLLFCYLGTASAVAGEIFCEQGIRDVWDRISEENREKLSGSECIVAQFAGDIVVGDGRKIDAFLSSNMGFYLLLDSNGGNLWEALKIGRLVK